MGAGHLDVRRFEELLDRNPEIAEVELSNYGEMFLNPRLTEIMRIAAARKVVLHADNGTNMNHVSDDTLEAPVRYRFRSITVSIDGASEETYARYRVRGSFERVLGNIQAMAFGLQPGKYTLRVLPKRLDPAFRTAYPAIPPVTQAITVAERPVAQEFRVVLAGG